ncbi:MAG: hypothetical protein ACYDBJ_29445, partial [Aggregatilineales bacterium]
GLRIFVETVWIGKEGAGSLRRLSYGENVSNSHNAQDFYTLKIMRLPFHFSIRRAISSPIMKR